MSAGDGRRIVVSSRSGRVAVTAEDRDDVEVEGASEVTDASGETTVRGTSQRVEIRCPTGTDVVVGTASSSVTLRGRFGDVRVTTQSGRIDVEAAGAIEARSVSGRITIDSTARARVQSTSGRIEVGLEAGADADVTTVSSSVRITVPHGAHPAVDVRTVSGSVRAPDPGDEGRISVQTVSSSVRITER